MVGKNVYPNQLGQNNPACVLFNIYPVLGCQINQVGLFLTQQFLECTCAGKILYTQKSK